MYAVFNVAQKDSAMVEEVLKDDLVSRQSISIRDALSLGAKVEGTLVLIEGSSKAIERSSELFKGIGKRLRGKKAEGVYNLFKKQEEDVAQGMGFIFG